MKKSLIVLFLMMVATTSWAVPASSECKPQVCEKQDMGPFAYNYRKDIGLTCPNDFYIRGDFLLFQPQEEGLEYAYINTGSHSLPANNEQIIGFSSESHKWDWNFGARVGIGGYMPYDGWNLDLTWTYLGIKQNDEVKPRNGEEILALFISPAIFDSFNHASAHWSGSFNSIDLSLGKPYFISKKFILDPFASIKGVWIDQDFVARYSYLYFNPQPTIEVFKCFAKNDFLGLGIRAGAKAEILLGNCASLFCSLAGSVIYGKFDVTQSFISNFYSWANYNLKRDYYSITPNMELYLGASWAQKFSEDKYRMALSIAYEFNYFWNQLHLLRFVDAENYIAGSYFVSPNNLAFGGLSFRIQFDF